MNKIHNSTELKRRIIFCEEERDRSMKWFFINLVGMLVSTTLAVWLTPKLISYIAIKWLGGVNRKVLTVSSDYENVLRLKHLENFNTILVVLIFVTGLFWVLFRFRKWTKYRHQVHILKKEDLEK